MADWQQHLLTSDAAIGDLLGRVRSIAVLGIKTADSGAPAFYVPEYAQRAGYKIHPVPVYYPEVTEILGEPVVRSVRAIDDRVDLVNVFRRPQDIPQHLDDLLAARPRAVWFQLGIRHDGVAEELARNGIDVVQDKCLMVELSNRGR
ncbi:CoA-binding protein [Pseudogemmatithrix spongiicola]|uniref:CoA-binding protein n=1 Tax=Pseudogemmatithrix spongiicola TaxID=3062599 RepID=A0AA49JSE0_9BACT|nr:CoA-binding protein [Gemmatimonadaceae bacterium 'strain 138']WKW13952.1 CoA-binding protein [Gemmatimonadaceae bacterium 'strain 318']